MIAFGNNHISTGNRFLNQFGQVCFRFMLGTHNLSAFVARKLSGLIITAEVIKDGANKAVTGDTDYEI
jgi:hypothetical protein